MIPLPPIHPLQMRQASGTSAPEDDRPESPAWAAPIDMPAPIPAALTQELQARGLAVPEPLQAMTAELRRRGLAGGHDLPDQMGRLGSDLRAGARIQQIERDYEPPPAEDRAAHIERELGRRLADLEATALASARGQDAFAADRGAIRGTIERALLGPSLPSGEQQALMRSIPGAEIRRIEAEAGAAWDREHSADAEYLRRREEAWAATLAEQQERYPDAPQAEHFRAAHRELQRLGYQASGAAGQALIDQRSIDDLLRQEQAADAPLVDRLPIGMDALYSALTGGVEASQQMLGTVAGTVLAGGAASLAERITGSDMGIRAQQDAIRHYWREVAPREGLMRGTEAGGLRGEALQFARVMGQVGGDLANMAVAGSLTGGMAAASGLSLRLTNLAQTLGAMGYMGLQEGGGTYDAVYVGLRQAGLDHDQAQGRALAAGAGVGLVNALIERQRIVQVLRSPGASTRLRGAIRGAIGEGSTEGAQELVSVLADFAAAHGTSAQDPIISWDNVRQILTAVAAGGVVGGGFGAVTRGRGLDSDRDETMLALQFASEQARGADRMAERLRQSEPIAAQIDEMVARAQQDAQTRLQESHGGLTDPGAEAPTVRPGQTHPQVLATARQAATWATREFGARQPAIEQAIRDHGRLRLVQVPVAFVEPAAEARSEAVAEILDQDPQSRADMPPSVLVPGGELGLQIVDGQQRIGAAQQAGQGGTIPAYVPQQIAQQIADGTFDPLPSGPDVSGQALVTAEPPVAERLQPTEGDPFAGLMSLGGILGGEQSAERAQGFARQLQASLQDPDEGRRRQATGTLLAEFADHFGVHPGSDPGSRRAFRDLSPQERQALAAWLDHAESVLGPTWTTTEMLRRVEAAGRPEMSPQAGEPVSDQAPGARAPRKTGEVRGVAAPLRLESADALIAWYRQTYPQDSPASAEALRTMAGEGPFELRQIPISRIDAMTLGGDVRSADVEAIAGMAAEQRQQLPPLIAGERNGRFLVADGTHRFLGAQQAGDQTIAAYVPAAEQAAAPPADQGRIQTDEQAQQTLDETQALVARLRESIGPLVQQARENPLTGGLNRREFDRLLAQAIEEADATGQPIAVIALDLANLKAINDTRGEEAGNDALRQTWEVIAANTRDVGEGRQADGFHYGGDEYAVLLRGLTPEDASGAAQAVMERIEQAAGRAEIVPGVSRFLVGGYQVYEPGTSGPQTQARLVGDASQAMKRRKQAAKAAAGEATDRAQAERAVRESQAQDDQVTRRESSSGQGPADVWAGDGPGGQPRTGQPASFRAFRGSGRADPAAVYTLGEAGGPILGPGLYAAPSREAAADFGPNVEELTVRLERPLVITSDRMAQDWAGQPIPWEAEEMRAWGQRLRDAVLREGFDGVVVNLPAADVDWQGDSLKRLANVFGTSQVIRFDAPETPAPVATDPESEAPPAETPSLPQTVAEARAQFGGEPGTQAWTAPGGQLVATAARVGPKGLRLTWTLDGDPIKAADVDRMLAEQAAPAPTAELERWTTIPDDWLGKTLQLAGSSFRLPRGQMATNPATGRLGRSMPPALSDQFRRVPNDARSLLGWARERAVPGEILKVSRQRFTLVPQRLYEAAVAANPDWAAEVRQARQQRASQRQETGSGIRWQDLGWADRQRLIVEAAPTGLRPSVYLRLTQDPRVAQTIEEFEGEVDYYQMIISIAREDGLLPWDSNAWDDIDFVPESAGGGETLGQPAFRFSQSGRANQAVQYMQFAFNPERNVGYGPRGQVFDTDNVPAARIVDAAEPKFRRAVERAVDDQPGILDDLGYPSVDALIDEANPADIVDSAQTWDDTPTVSWLWENVLKPNDWAVVTTQDGAIVFDPTIPRQMTPQEVEAVGGSPDRRSVPSSAATLGMPTSPPPADPIQALIAELQAGLSVRQSKRRAAEQGFTNDPVWQQALEDEQIRRAEARSDAAKRAARQEADRETRAEEQIEAVSRALTDAGAVLEHQSTSGSRYYRLQDGRLIRVADHEVPQTEWRQFTQREGAEPRWDEDLIFSGRGTVEQALRRLKSEVLSEGETLSMPAGSSSWPAWDISPTRRTYDATLRETHFMGTSEVAMTIRQMIAGRAALTSYLNLAANHYYRDALREAKARDTSGIDEAISLARQAMRQARGDSETLVVGGNIREEFEKLSNALSAAERVRDLIAAGNYQAIAKIRINDQQIMKDPRADLDDHTARLVGLPESVVDDSEGEVLGMPAGRSRSQPAPRGGPPVSSDRGWTQPYSPSQQQAGAAARGLHDRPASVRTGLARAWARRNGQTADKLDTVYRITEDLARRLNIGHPGVGRSGQFRTQAGRWSTQGFFRPATEAIRLRRGNWFSVFAHELGHALHQSIFHPGRPINHWLVKDDFPVSWRADLEAMGRDLYGDKKPTIGYEGEGWAEFWRLYLTNPRQLRRERPGLYRDVKMLFQTEQPEAWIVLREAQLRYRIASRQAAAQPGSQLIYRGGRWSNLNWIDIRDWFKTRWTDRMQRLKTFTEDLGLQLDAVEDPHVRALRANGYVSGDFKTAMQFGRFNPADPLRRKTGKGLDEILQPVMDQIHSWEAYMVERRILEKRAQGLEVYADDPRGDGSLSNASLRESIRRTEAANPEFKQAADEFQEFNEWLIGDYATAYGLISPQQASAIIKANQYYITFRHIRAPGAMPVRGARSSRSGFSGQGSGIRRFRAGLGEELAPPLHSFIGSMQGIMARARMNEVARMVVDLGQRNVGGGRWLDRVTRPMQGTRVHGQEISSEVLKQLGVDASIDDAGQLKINNLPAWLQGMPESDLMDLLGAFEALDAATFWRPGDFVDREARQITVMRDGKPQWYEIKDPQLFDLLEGLHTVQATGDIVRFMGLPARAIRAGATQLNPSFFIPNWMRDTMQALTLTETEMRKLPEQVRGRLEGMKEAFLGGDIHRMFLASGADMSGLFGEYYDPRKQNLNYKAMFEKPRKFGLVKGDSYGRMMLDFAKLGAIDRLNQSFELANRLGEFKVAYEQARERGLSESKAMALAGQQAADITIDFQRGGTWAKQINQFVPFFNVAILGTDRLARFIRKDPLKALGRIGSTIILPSLIQFLLNWDNEDYWAKPFTDRDRHWFIPLGRNDDGGMAYLKIPKPYGLGAFAIALERSLARGVGIDPQTGRRGDQQAFRGVITAMIDELRPTVSLAGLQPLFEVMAGERGWSFFRGQYIVPASDANLPAGEQGASRSSDLARVLGSWMDYPPAKIDYLIQGWFGGLGRDAIQTLVDPAIRVTGGGTITRTGEPIEFSDWLVIRRFMSGQTRGGHEAITRFYETHQHLQRINRGLTARQHEPESFERFEQRHAAELAQWPLYSRAQRQVGQHMAELRRLYRERKQLDADTFESEVDRLYAAIIEIARDTHVSAQPERSPRRDR